MTQNLTEQQKEIAINVMRDLGYTGGWDEGCQLIAAFHAALPEPEPCGWVIEFTSYPTDDGEVVEKHFVTEMPEGEYLNCATAVYDHKQTGPQVMHDLGNVMRLTHQKTQSVVERGYDITGFVLTDKSGFKCISDMSAVRWFNDPQAFFSMMHAQPQVASSNMQLLGYVDAKQLALWDTLRGTSFETTERCYLPFSKEPFSSDMTDCTLAIYKQSHAGHDHESV